MLSPDNIKDIYPLTPFQEGVLYHDLIDQEAVTDEPRAYFQQMLFRVRGPFVMDAFEAAWRHLIGRHDILRTVFRTAGNGRPLQIVLKSCSFTLDRRDMGWLSADQRHAALAAYAEEERARPFTLEQALLIRIGCLRFDPLDHAVVWNFHHILLDGWCIGLVQDELAAAYQAFAAGTRPIALPATPFGRFVQWVEARRGDARLSFWKGYLSGYETVLDLPGQRPLPQAGRRDPQTLRLSLDVVLTARLGVLAREQGVTANTLMQALWGLVLGKYNYSRDVVFGSVASTRPPELAGSETMLGPCIGMLPLRVRFEAGDSFRDLLNGMRESALDWLDNVHCALADIQARQGARSSLFNHYFVFENYPLDERFKGDAQELAPGVTLGDVSLFMASNYDFCLRALPGERLLLEFEYNTRVVDPSAIAALAERWLHLAAAVADLPDAPLDSLSLLSAVERAVILDEWSHGAPPACIAATVPELRAAVLEAGGARPALRGAHGTLSHLALQRRAEALARQLKQRHGIAVGSAVAVLAQPGEPMLRAMLACLLLGAAFVPVDPALPAARLRHLLADSGATLLLNESPYAIDEAAGRVTVLTLSSADAGSWEAAGCTEPLPAVPTDAPAYIIYTSGTSGEPKGVRVGQSSLLNYVGWLNRDLAIDAQAATALVTSAAFDLGYTGVFGALLLGGCLTLLDEDERRDPERVMRALVDDRLTFLKATPSYLHLLLASAAGERFAEAEALTLLLLGGEPQNFDDLARLKKMRPELRIFNHYGPTEATIGCVAGCLDYLIGNVEAAQWIGRPVAGARVVLCDPALMPVPPGVPGELLVGGASLAQGYVNPSSVDSGRFITLPLLDGARMYRTGDMAQWQPDGSIVFLGRRDDQLKVRGHRVMLSGVEAGLRENPWIKDAVVLADDGNDLVAYVILADAAPAFVALRAELAGRLPDSMIPSHFIPVSRFPLTANGKIDRAALVTHRRSRPTLVPGSVPSPCGGVTEEALCALWADILFVDQVGPDDDFFALGGHSIKAILMIARVRKSLTKAITLRELFDNPTPRRLAILLDGGERAAVSSLLVLRPAATGSPAALFLPPGLGTTTAYKELVLSLTTEVACWGVQCPGFDSDAPFAPSIEALADFFAAQAATLHGAGSLRLIGWSFGAHLAVETARRLEWMGRSVRLVLIDAAPRRGGSAAISSDVVEPFFTSFAELRGRPYWGRVLSIIMNNLPSEDVARLERLARHNGALLAYYNAAAGPLVPIASDIVAIEAMDSLQPAEMQGFSVVTSGRLEVHRVPGDHYSLFHPPHLARVLALLDRALAD